MVKLRQKSKFCPFGGQKILLWITFMKPLLGQFGDGWAIFTFFLHYPTSDGEEENVEEELATLSVTYFY